MKKKLLSNTYLNEAEKYQIKFFLDEEDKYVVVKKLIKLSKPFIIKNNVIAMKFFPNTCCVSHWNCRFNYHNRIWIIFYY